LRGIKGADLSGVAALLLEDLVDRIYVLHTNELQEGVVVSGVDGYCVFAYPDI